MLKIPPVVNDVSIDFLTGKPLKGISCFLDSFNGAVCLLGVEPKQLAQQTAIAPVVEYSKQGFHIAKVRILQQKEAAI